MKPAATFIAALIFITLIGLGVWQVQRLHWKEQLIATIAARTHEAPVDVTALALSDADFHPVFAHGVFLHDASIFVHAIERGTGAGGYRVVTPLRIIDKGCDEEALLHREGEKGWDEGALRKPTPPAPTPVSFPHPSLAPSQGRGYSSTTTHCSSLQKKYILIDRGFIPFAARESGYVKPDDRVTVRGMARVPHHAAMQPANDPTQGEWYWPDITAVGQAFPALAHAELLPFIVAEDAGADSTLFPHGGQTEINLRNDHLGYAITWFTLAAAFAVIYGLSARRKL